jgi:hypothetical protein
LKQDSAMTSQMDEHTGRYHDDLVEPGIKAGERGSPEYAQAIRQSAMTTAAAGMAHGVLLLFAFWLIKSRTPGAGASQAEILSYYGDPNHRRLVLFAGIYLIPFAGIAFIWFTVALRAWVGQIASRIDIIRSNILLVCGVIYITLIFSAGASMSVMSTSIDLGGQSADANLSRNFLLYGTSLFLVFAMRMASMVVTTMTGIGRATGILPRWLQMVGFVVALGMMLVSSFNSWFVIVFPLWLIVFGIFMLRRAWEIPSEGGFPLPPAVNTVRAQLNKVRKSPARRSKVDGD